jgi:predicted NBD/HSP70 family sugar kinase
MAQEFALPALPVSLEQLLPYIGKQENTPITELFQPFREYDAKIRELYAQAPETIGNGIANAVSIFDGPGLKTRARNIAAESSQESDRYIMPLTDENRHTSGTPATVPSIKEFKHNFSVFTEMCLSDMDWGNVVVGGSAALTPLLPYFEPFLPSRAYH